MLAQQIQIFVAGLVGLVVLFVLVWGGVCMLLRKIAGLTPVRARQIITGAKIDESGWGSASVNGVHCKKCLKITRYENGLELRMMPIFLPGYLWLSFDTLKIGELTEGRFHRMRFRSLTSGENKVRAYGWLAEFVGK